MSAREWDCAGMSMHMCGSACGCAQERVGMRARVRECEQKSTEE